MTSIPIIMAQLDAVEEDLAATMPFEMVVLSEFGIVKGYSPDYAALRADAVASLEFCDVYFPELNTRLGDIPHVGRNEQVNEGKLAAEIGTICAEIRRVRAALAAVPRETAISRLRQAAPEDRRWFAALLQRSGITVAPRSHEASPVAQTGILSLGHEQAPPIERAPTRRAEATSGERERIYVGDRFSIRLTDQIANALDESGYDPVLGLRGGSDEGLEECSGGVFSLMTSATPGAPPTLSISAIATQIRKAPIRVQSKMLLVGREACVARNDLQSTVPPQLSKAPIFALKNDVMDASERARFAALTSRPIWRSAAHPA